MEIRKNHLIALCIVGAAVVAATGHDGWGWLIFLAVFMVL